MDRTLRQFCLEVNTNNFRAFINSYIASLTAFVEIEKPSEWNPKTDNRRLKTTIEGTLLECKESFLFYIYILLF